MHRIPSRCVLSLLWLVACQESLPVDQRVARSGVPGALELSGGHWWNGETFVEGTRYVQDGIFVETLGGEPDSVVDLAGRYVVPPFGDAHAHNLDSPAQVDAHIGLFLADGIFYVQILNNLASGANTNRPRFNRPDGIDVVFSHGGITSEFGHPRLLYEGMALGLFAPQQVAPRCDELRQNRTREGEAYWIVDSAADLDEKWEAIRATEPDVLKIYLLYTADGGGTGTCEEYGMTGLSPEVAGAVVTRAQEAGIPVYAHVETADDFRIGLDIGVDGFAHMPGYGNHAPDDVGDYRLSDELVRRAGEAEVIITPIIALGAEFAEDSASAAATLELKRDNLSRLHAAGARIAVGMDGYGITSRLEVQYLHDQEFFDNATLLDIWARMTPQAIFPDRLIGELRSGFEASFLVLGGNPLEDFAATAEIQRMMKQGAWIRVRDRG